MISKYLRKSDLRKMYHIESLNHEPPTHIIKIDDKKYLVQRTGKCEPKKCNAICCKFCHINITEHQSVKYWKGFGESTGGGIRINNICSNLKRNKCMIWNTKKFPGCCKEFPHPHDGVYIEIADKCSFRFKVLGELIAPTT